jgi:hypothetical protein
VSGSVEATSRYVTATPAEEGNPDPEKNEACIFVHAADNKVLQTSKNMKKK